LSSVANFQVIKGEERSSVKSRYEEDVLNGNHTTVWGSYWCEGKWGYKCCHSFLKKSYCTGSAGKEQQVCLDLCFVYGHRSKTKELLEFLLLILFTSFK